MVLSLLKKYFGGVLLIVEFEILVSILGISWFNCGTSGLLKKNNIGGNYWIITVDLLPWIYRQRQVLLCGIYSR